MLSGASSRIWFYLVTVVTVLGIKVNGSTTQRRRHDECILFKGNSTYAVMASESYLELGFYDIEPSRDFEISFEVLPSATMHDGPLFSIGTEKFAYYEWKTKAVDTQFVVVEFFYSAISMLLKAQGHPHMVQVEIHRTHPHIYVLNDVRWHTIRASRIVPQEGVSGSWMLEMDNLSEVRNMTSVIDVNIMDCKAYLGGRPGYRSSQFRGVIRNLFINGERVRLRGKATYGLTEVWHCSAPEVGKFVEELQAEVNPDPRRKLGGSSREQGYDDYDDEDSMDRGSSRP